MTDQQLTAMVVGMMLAFLGGMGMGGWVATTRALRVKDESGGWQVWQDNAEDRAHRMMNRAVGAVQEMVVAGARAAMVMEPNPPASADGSDGRGARDENGELIPKDEFEAAWWASRHDWTDEDNPDPDPTENKDRTAWIPPGVDPLAFVTEGRVVAAGEGAPIPGGMPDVSGEQYDE